MCKTFGTTGRTRTNTRAKAKEFPNQRELFFCMLKVIGQDDPATVYTREAKINLAPLLCNKGELTAEIKNETTFSHITGVCWRIKRSSAGAMNLA